MANIYTAGATVRLSCPFTVSGVATDPTTITLYLKGGNIGLLTYTYAGGQIVRDSQGNYHYDYVIPVSGTYYYRWEGSGTVPAASEGTFTATSTFK